MRKKESYHHGDLSNALVRVAFERVRCAGVENFKLREVARDVGVTPGAAYNHFSDRAQLLAAVALEAQILLAQRTLKATSGLTGLKRLEAIGRAYVKFACEEPSLFRLVFSGLGVGSLRVSYETADGRTVPSSYEQLRMAAADIRRDKQKPVDEDRLALAWSVAHGAASLIGDGVWKKNDRRADAALRLAVEVMST